jgi:hypothetical protein
MRQRLPRGRRPEPGKSSDGEDNPMRKLVQAAACGGLLLAATLNLPVARASAATASPAVLSVGQIDRQDVPSANGCEPDTLVEPDVAVSPFNRAIQVAVAHDCRFSNGGAVDISYAWTHDGGAHWHHAPVPGLTKAVGGSWDRASDPVVAFGADGSVYINALVFDVTCPSGLTVSRSTDGGATFSAPVLVHESNRCSYSDDKNWIIADTQPTSPFYGRIYVFWTPFIARQGTFIGSPEVVRWSDDRGATWSSTHLVGAETENAQNSQPMIQPNGRITDVYLIYRSPSSFQAKLVARTSDNGGATWSSAFHVAFDIGVGPPDIRCCLPASTADPVTGKLYTVWLADAPGETVLLSTSSNGHDWSAPTAVTHNSANPNIQHVNTDVAAYDGRVFVSYALRNLSQSDGRYLQQQVSTSYNGGASFGAPVSLGPRSDLKYAAVAGALFPGDYIGLSATQSALVAVWCVSSKPPNPDAAYHQTLYAAELRP